MRELIDKTPETVSNLKRGSALTGVETLEIIADGLSIPLSQFFEEFDRDAAPNRDRLELENRFRYLVSSLSDQDLRSAIDLVEAIVKRGTN